MPDSKQKNLQCLNSNSDWKKVESRISDRRPSVTVEETFSKGMPGYSGPIYNTFRSKLLFMEKAQNIDQKCSSNHEIKGKYSMTDIIMLDEQIRNSRECDNRLLGSKLDRLPFFIRNCGKVNMNYTKEKAKENLEDEITFQILSSRSSTPYTLSLADNKIHSGLSSPEYSTPVKVRDNLSKIGGSADFHFIIEGPGGTCSKLAQITADKKKIPGYLYKYSKESLEKIRSRELKTPEILIPNVVYCDNIELEVRLRKFNIFKMKESASYQAHPDNKLRIGIERSSQYQKKKNYTTNLNVSLGCQIQNNSIPDGRNFVSDGCGKKINPSKMVSFKSDPFFHNFRKVCKSDSMLQQVVGEGDIAASHKIDFQKLILDHDARNKSEKFSLFNQSIELSSTLDPCFPGITDRIWVDSSSAGLDDALHSFKTQKGFAVKQPNLTLSGLDILTVDKLEASWKQKPLLHNVKKGYNGGRNETHPKTVEIRQLTKDDISKSILNKSFTNKGSISNISVYANDVLKVFIQKLQFQEKHKNQLLRLQQQQQQAALIASLHMKTVLRRPECHLILQNLIKGEISKHGLMIHLANPSLTQRDRESITAVLTFTSESPPLQFIYNNSLLKIFKQFEHVPFLDHKLSAKNVPVENLISGPLTFKSDFQANLHLHTNLLQPKIL